MKEHVLVKGHTLLLLQRLNENLRDIFDGLFLANQGVVTNSIWNVVEVGVVASDVRIEDFNVLWVPAHQANPRGILEVKVFGLRRTRMQTLGTSQPKLVISEGPIRPNLPGLSAELTLGANDELLKRKAQRCQGIAVSMVIQPTFYLKRPVA